MRCGVSTGVVGGRENVIGERLGAAQNAARVIIGFEKRHDLLVQDLLNALVGQNALHAASGFHFDAVRIEDDQKQHAVIQVSLADFPSIEKRRRELFGRAMVGLPDRDNRHFRARAPLQSVEQRVQARFGRAVHDARHVADPGITGLARIHDLRQRFRFDPRTTRCKQENTKGQLAESAKHHDGSSEKG